MPAAKKSSKKPASKAVTKPTSSAAAHFPKAPTWFKHMATYAEKNPSVVLVGGIAVLLGLMLLIG